MDLIRIVSGKNISRIPSAVLSTRVRLGNRMFIITILLSFALKCGKQKRVSFFKDSKKIRERLSLLFTNRGSLFWLTCSRLFKSTFCNCKRNPIFLKCFGTVSWILIFTISNGMTIYKSANIWEANSLQFCHFQPKWQASSVLVV